jgi:hypothetical protein
MSKLIKSTILVLLVLPTLVVSASRPDSPLKKFDEFGDINCESEYARLDNFAVQLQNEPQFKGLIIFYGGKTFRGRLPKRGEAEARAARLIPYLVDRRAIAKERLTVINGGYADKWRAELWVVPTGAMNPNPNPTVAADKVRFGKGKVTSRTYRCGI